ncbi:unnamed protein product [Pleuronectes platessa]|uniref:Uncharacterized protein n=1 Tax=Pleuronectes platessa TaxID=8262 RepID=A0A9N7U8P9_PLEPL|nr:unnamed protein product [Pleuronectes platessa]
MSPPVAPWTGKPASKTSSWMAPCVNSQAAARTEFAPQPQSSAHSSCPTSQPPSTATRHPPPRSISSNCCPLHQLAELPVPLATGPGSCPAPLAQLKSCHFLIDSGLSFCLCSPFPIWQWSQLFSAKDPEKRLKEPGVEPPTFCEAQRFHRMPLIYALCTQLKPGLYVLSSSGDGMKRMT